MILICDIGAWRRFDRPGQLMIAAVAAARELVGFMWAVMRDLEIQQATALDTAA